MSQPTVAPYGTWKSPITSDVVASTSIGLADVRIDNGDIYWLESRPVEGGRNVIVSRTAGGVNTDLNPAPYNARTRVHEYGGGAWLIVDGTAFYANFADQRLYRQMPGAAPVPFTPALDLRYADFVYDRSRKRLIAVREDHTQPDQQAVNTLVSLPLQGEVSGGQVLAAGYDFYASPRISPDGGLMAWLSWNHPNMPWDGCELWVGEIAGDGSIANASLVAGGLNESIFQPEWSPDGALYFVSDRSNWWNIYRAKNGVIEAVCARAAEFGLPQWAFGLSTYGFESANSIICTYTENGSWRLARLDTQTGALTRFDLPFCVVRNLRVSREQAVFISGDTQRPGAVIRLDLASGQSEELRHASEISFDPGFISVAQSIEFPTDNGLTAYGFYYAPQNRDYVAPAGEKPPLLVKSHGGPTGDATPEFHLSMQYWTSRGYAVFDVNYGGSTGFGRAYRQRLNGQWGVVDLNDVVNGAKYLVAQGLADGARLAIDGGSAGGYTTLAALTFRDVFKVGASYYGISDLEGLATDTHKFESRYLDSMIGPYPEQKAVYYERSPIHYVERINCPMILFQGLEDKVVLPDQSLRIYQALRAKGLPVAYVPYAGEQHGFRRAENIRHALDSEYYFFSRVFGFKLSDAGAPVVIENSEKLPH
jgi:dipeptidyl aminopeptidase/acylaminoacyl peptidase